MSVGTRVFIFKDNTEGTITNVERGWFTVTNSRTKLRAKEFRKIGSPPKNSPKHSPKHSPKFSPRRSSPKKASSKSSNSSKSSKESKCKESFLKKYQNRPGPPMPANDCAGLKRYGNDNVLYESKPDKNGVHRWIKVKHEYLD